MHIEFTPGELFPAVSSAYRVVESETDDDQVGLEIQIRGDGLVTFWFQSIYDLQAFINRINHQVVKACLVSLPPGRQTSLVPLP